MEGIQFFPIVVEAIGGWHSSDAAAAVSKLAIQLTSHTIPVPMFVSC